MPEVHKSGSAEPDETKTPLAAEAEEEEADGVGAPDVASDGGTPADDTASVSAFSLMPASV